jgi:lipopolysaccharide transport system permease protein
MNNNKKKTMLRHPAYYILTHKHILLRVISVDLKTRYAGSFLGLGWAFILPLITMAIYAVVYLVIFQIRVPGLSPLGYVLLMFSGLVPFLMTGETLAAGVSSIIKSKSVLSNTVFPIDLIAIQIIVTSQITMIVGLLIILPVSWLNGNLGWQVVLLPMIWLLHILALIGLVWILSLLNIVFRDLQNLINPIILILMILSPIAYTPEMVPDNLKIIVYANPFAYYIVAYQKILVLNQIPGIYHMILLFFMSVGLFYAGGMFFSYSKRYMIDHV